jgi:hypothetical protein
MARFAESSIEKNDIITASEYVFVIVLAILILLVLFLPSMGAAPSVD